MFAQLIARTAKDIEILIESLPDEEGAKELALGNSLQKLELQNQDAAKRLEASVVDGQNLLSRVQDALADIAKTQITASNLGSSKT